jgi:hypothetical protein
MRPSILAHRRATSAVATALAALLLSGCTTASRVDVPWLGLSLRLPGATPRPSPKAVGPQGTAAPTPGAPALTIEQFVPIAEQFVEQHRGLKFKSPVQVTLLDDAAFRERLLGKQNSSPGNDQAIATTSKDLVALHLIDRSVDLGSSARDLLGAGVSGFYEPKSKSLVVRGVAATPYVRQVIVHELTHALQDQWFGIDRPQLDRADDETAVAFQTVVEGDAVRIENQYHDAMTPQEQFQADREEQGQGGGLPADVPRVLVELVAFPYILGPRFIDELDQLGGQQKIDDAFVHPPVSTAQILDVRRFVDGSAPRVLPVPHADGTAYDHGVLGEFGLLLLLENVAGMSAADALQVAADWGGDEYVAWTKGTTPCLRLAMAAVTAGEQGPLDTALRRFASAARGSFSDASGSGPAVVTTCG